MTLPAEWEAAQKQASVPLPEATATAHARKGSGTDLGTIWSFSPALGMTSFNCNDLTQRNHREESVRSSSLTVTALGVEPSTTKEGGNNYHTVHLHLPTAARSLCQGNRRCMACKERGLEGHTFHGGGV